MQDSSGTRFNSTSAICPLIMSISYLYHQRHSLSMWLHRQKVKDVVHFNHLCRLLRISSQETNKSKLLYTLLPMQHPLSNIGFANIIDQILRHSPINPTFSCPEGGFLAPGPCAYATPTLKLFNYTYQLFLS